MSNQKRIGQRTSIYGFMSLLLPFLIIITNIGVSEAEPFKFFDFNADNSAEPSKSFYNFTLRDEESPLFHIFDGGPHESIAPENKSWQVVINGAETQGTGFGGDKLVISGSAEHLLGPHNEPIETTHRFDFTIDANDFKIGSNEHPMVFRNNILHGDGDHRDVYRTLLSFNIAEGENRSGNDIKSYSLRSNGSHTPGNGSQAPEPSTVILFASGVIGLLALTLSKRKVRDEVQS